MNVIKTGLGVGVVAIAIWAIFRQKTGAVSQFTFSGGEPSDLGAGFPVGLTATGGTGEVNLKNWTPPKEAAPYLDAIAQAETRYNLPKNLLARQLHQESQYQPDIISGKKKSPRGAIGIAQFMPETAKKDFGIDPTNPWQSIDAAGKYMRQLYNRFGTWPLALAAYNWGMGNLANKGMGKAPKETRNYLTKILGDIGLL